MTCEEFQLRDLNKFNITDYFFHFNTCQICKIKAFEYASDLLLDGNKLKYAIKRIIDNARQAATKTFKDDPELLKQMIYVATNDLQTLLAMINDGVFKLDMKDFELDRIKELKQRQKTTN